MFPQSPNFLLKYCVQFNYKVNAKKAMEHGKITLKSPTRLDDAEKYEVNEHHPESSEQIKKRKEKEKQKSVHPE